MTMFDKTYSKLITIPSFEKRYEYLRLNGVVGEETFGHDRWLNQLFYSTKEWRDFRRSIIIRDNGCDLGIEDREIHGMILVHHLNPISVSDVINRRFEILINPENAICVSKNTHNAIHYGDNSLLATLPVERNKNDTCPWRHN